MANKNTKNIRLAVRSAGKQGNNEVSFDVPVTDWHNHPKQSFRKITVTCARPNGEGVINATPRRNMQMRVLQNSNGNGGKDSITVHEPIDKGRFVVHPNHEYIRRETEKGRQGYFQPAK